MLCNREIQFWKNLFQISCCFFIYSIFWDNSSLLFGWSWGIKTWVRQRRHAQKHPLMFPSVFIFSSDRSVKLTWNHLKHKKHCMLNVVKMFLIIPHGKSSRDVSLVSVAFLWGTFPFKLPIGTSRNLGTASNKTSGLYQC